MTDGGDTGIILGLRRVLVRLLDLDLMISKSDIEECEDADDARRCLCILVGSTLGMSARRAKRERTGDEGH